MPPSIALRLEKTLEFEEPRDAVWDLLIDVPAVVACIPGARLLETVSESAWKAQIGVDLGLTQVTFIADVVRQELDSEMGRAALSITGEAVNGRGDAAVTLVSTVVATATGTKTVMVTDVEMSGQVARLGPGIVEDVSDDLTDQLVTRLRAELKVRAARAAVDHAFATPRPAAPVASETQPTHSRAPRSKLSKRRLLRVVLIGGLRRVVSRLGLTRRPPPQ